MGGHYRILTPNELDLSFPTPNDCTKFIKFHSNCESKIDDRQTDASVYV